MQFQTTFCPNSIMHKTSQMQQTTMNNTITNQNGSLNIVSSALHNNLQSNIQNQNRQGNLNKCQVTGSTSLDQRNKPKNLNNIRAPNIPQIHASNINTSVIPNTNVNAVRNQYQNRAPSNNQISLNANAQNHSQLHNNQPQQTNINLNQTQQSNVYNSQMQNVQANEQAVMVSLQCQTSTFQRQSTNPIPFQNQQSSLKPQNNPMNNSFPKKSYKMNPNRPYKLQSKSQQQQVQQNVSQIPQNSQMHVPSQIPQQIQNHQHIPNAVMNSSTVTQASVHIQNPSQINVSQVVQDGNFASILPQKIASQQEINNMKQKLDGSFCPHQSVMSHLSNQNQIGNSSINQNAHQSINQNAHQSINQNAGVQNSQITPANIKKNDTIYIPMAHEVERSVIMCPQGSQIVLGKHNSFIVI